MSLILAIEPDPGQSTQLAALVRERVRADLVQAPTTEGALAALSTAGDRVPDLVLVPSLLSPQEDAAMAGALRLIATAANVRMLTIPRLAAPEPPPPPQGLFARFRPRRRTTPDGCAPDVFAEQIRAYLAEAAAEREHRRADAGGDEAPAATSAPIADESGAPPPVAEPPAVATAAETDAPAESLPRPELTAPLPAAPLPLPEAEADVQAAGPRPRARTRKLTPASRALPVMMAPPPRRDDFDIDALIAPLLGPAEATPTVAATHAVGTSTVAVVVTTSDVDVPAAPAIDEPVSKEVAEEDPMFFAAPVPEPAVAPAPALERAPASMSTPVLASEPRVTSPPPVPASAVAVPAVTTAERSAWSELVDSLRQDIERLKAEREDVRAPNAHPVIPAAVSVQRVASRLSRPKARRPVQDQWGFFDPEQCGFAALLTKLDAIGARDDVAS